MVNGIWVDMLRLLFFIVIIFLLVSVTFVAYVFFKNKGKINFDERNKYLFNYLLKIYCIIVIFLIVGVTLYFVTVPEDESYVPAKFENGNFMEQEQ